VAGTYLVLAGDDGSLVMVDQHAAHERVLYESYRRQGRGGTSRDLAIPLDMPLHASQARVLRDSRSILSSLGFWLEIREAGATIKAVPGAMDPGEARSFLESAASGQVEGLEDLWVLLACRQAMKAAQPLAPGEAAQLLEAWLETENRDHCPHGRPVTARLTLRDMEKLFKRGK
jgi:DNA mismatch repair protein MutL